MRQGTALPRNFAAILPSESSATRSPCPNQIIVQFSTAVVFQNMHFQFTIITIISFF